MAERTPARITAFNPGASPPPVLIAIFLIFVANFSLFRSVSRVLVPSEERGPVEYVPVRCVALSSGPRLIYTVQKPISIYTNDVIKCADTDTYPANNNLNVDNVTNDEVVGNVNKNRLTTVRDVLTQCMKLPVAQALLEASLPVQEGEDFCCYMSPMSVKTK